MGLYRIKRDGEVVINEFEGNGPEALARLEEVAKTGVGRGVTLELMEGKCWKEQYRLKVQTHGMIWVNLQPDGFPSIGPIGIVHRGCEAMTERRGPGEWRQTADEHTADVDFPGYRLFWCDWSDCFGPNNPRRLP